MSSRESSRFPPYASQAATHASSTLLLPFPFAFALASLGSRSIRRFCRFCSNSSERREVLSNEHNFAKARLEHKVRFQLSPRLLVCHFCKILEGKKRKSHGEGDPPKYLNFRCMTLTSAAARCSQRVIQKGKVQFSN